MKMIIGRLPKSAAAYFLKLGLLLSGIVAQFSGAKSQPVHCIRATTWRFELDYAEVDYKTPTHPEKAVDNDINTYTSWDYAEYGRYILKVGFLHELDYDDVIVVGYSNTIFKVYPDLANLYITTDGSAQFDILPLLNTPHTKAEMELKNPGRAREVIFFEKNLIPFIPDPNDPVDTTTESGTFKVHYVYVKKNTPVAERPVYNICKGESVNLRAVYPQYSTAPVNWYDSSQGGPILATGYTFKTPRVSDNKQYYIAAVDSVNQCISPTRAIVNISVASQQYKFVEIKTNKYLYRDGSQAIQKGLLVKGKPHQMIQGFWGYMGSSSLHAEIHCLDSNLNNIWTTKINSIQELQKVQKCPDGGYLLGGDIITDKGRDIAIAKIDAVGHKIWEHRYGGSKFDHFVTATVANDDKGGYYLFCTTTSADGNITGAAKGGRDIWVIKVDGKGIIQWDKVFGGTKDDEPIDVVMMPQNNGLLISGYTDSPAGGDVTTGTHGAQDYWIIRLDNNGNKLWDKTFGGNYNDIPSNLVMTTNKEYFIAGTTGSSNGDISHPRGDDDFWLLKINKDGIKQWDSTYGGSSRDELVRIVPIEDGGYLLAGNSKSGDAGSEPVITGSVDYMIVKIDANGKKQGAVSFKTINEISGALLNFTPGWNKNEYWISGVWDEKIINQFPVYLHKVNVSGICPAK